MIMRFYWGLGIGHVYSHEDTIMERQPDNEIMESEDEELDLVKLSEDVPMLEGQGVDEDEDFEHLGVAEAIDLDDEGWVDSDEEEEDSPDNPEGCGDSDEEDQSGYGGMDSVF